MNTSIAPIAFNFNSHEVRTIQQDDVVWFVASDISNSLNYRDARDLTRVLDDDETDTHTVRIRSENGVEQEREVLIINESGLYHALFKSRKKEAQVFRKWVTSEVLPAIRKTGSYQVKAKPTTKALPHCLTVEQQKAIQTLVKSRAESIPDQSKWAGATIKQYSVLKSKFGVGYKEIPESQFSEALNIIARIVLDGEVINEKPQCFKPLKWTRIGDQHPNANHAHTILSEIKRWLYHYDTPVARDLHDALTDVGRVITTATTEMQEAVVNLKIGMHYLNRFRK